ncbi:MAG: succinate dehydrogenase cytochrome b subunit [Gemmatimonadota bacterium]
MASRLAAFYRSSVGKKIIMGVTGLILVGFVVSHVLGNLLIFQGPGKLDEYSAFLRSTGKLLWIARGGLLVAVILHIDAAFKLTVRSRSGRPLAYVRRQPQASTMAARSMRAGGVLLLVFIVFHLLHFTFGTVHPDRGHFNHEMVTHNLLTGFPSIWFLLLYEVSMIALGMHLYHGTVAMMMSLGVSHPRYTPLWRKIAAALAVLVAAGFMTIPLAIFFHVIG